MSPQGGIANRDMVSVRVECVPDEKVEAMDAYFTDLAAKNEKGLAKFNIAFGPILNLLRFFTANSLASRGNCAYWTSRGLAIGGVASPSMFPKVIFIDMLENGGSYSSKFDFSSSPPTSANHPAVALAGKVDVSSLPSSPPPSSAPAGALPASWPESNISVVSYRRDRAAHPKSGVVASPLSAVAPLQPLRSWFYLNLEAFAHAIVSVPPGAHAPIVTPVPYEERKHPSPWRNAINSRYVALPSVLVSIMLIRFTMKRLL